MKSARSRTIRMFPDEPPPAPKRPSRRTMRRRICNAAIDLYLDKPGASADRIMELCHELLTLPD